MGGMEPDIEAALQRSFLGRLPRDLVDRLVEGQLRMDVPADTTIYREGETSRAFLIISGLFRLFLVSGDGRQVTSGTAGLRTFWGRLSSSAARWTCGRRRSRPARSWGSTWVGWRRPLAATRRWPRLVSGAQPSP